MGDSKRFIKLVNHVALFLKAIGDGYTSRELHHVEENLKVNYNLKECEAYIYPTPCTYSYGSGVESIFDYQIVDILAQLSEKHTISYRIGKDEHGFLHFQIYV